MLARYISDNTNKLNTHSLLIIKIPLKPLSPILIQQRSEDNIREMYTIEIRREGAFFVIPSSSLKGAFRKISLGIAKTITSSNNQGIFNGKENESLHLHSENADIVHYIDKLSIRYDEYKEYMKICKLIKGSACVKLFRNYERLRKCEEKWNKECEKLILSEKTFLDFVYSLYCPICSLYGSRYYAGSISFTPVLIKHREGRAITRYHVSIDRKTRTKVGKALFTDKALYLVDEYLDLYIKVNDIEFGSATARLLALTLEYIGKAGLLVGGAKSIGYGFLEVVKENAEALLYDYNNLDLYLEPKRIKGLTNITEVLSGRTI